LQLRFSVSIYTNWNTSNNQSPNLRTTNPGFYTGGSPFFYITNAGGEPRVKPGVWRPEMWALLNSVGSYRDVEMFLKYNFGSTEVTFFEYTRHV
jgi:hypothetical protein